MESQEIKSDETVSGNQWWIIWVLLMIVMGAGVYFISNYLRLKATTEFNLCCLNCEKIGEAMELYADKNTGNYPRALTMLTPDYLKTIPVCPGAKSNQGYINSYRVNNDFKAYTFYCSGRNHKVGRPENYPQYNSRKGIVY